MTATHNLAFASCFKNNMDGTMVVCNKSIELKPDFAANYTARGNLEQSESDKVDMMADFNQAGRFMYPRRSNTPANEIITNEPGRGMCTSSLTTRNVK
jgi:hypothetical protein